MKQISLNTDTVKAICRKYKVGSMSLFGSTLRNEARPDSDIDLLVTFSQPTSLLQLVALERELTQALGRKVDLLTEKALSPYLRDQILAEQQLVYAA